MKSFFSTSKTVFGRKIPYRRKGNSSCKINLLCKITMNYMYIYIVEYLLHGMLKQCK